MKVTEQATSSGRIVFLGSYCLVRTPKVYKNLALDSVPSKSIPLRMNRNCTYL